MDTCGISVATTMVTQKEIARRLGVSPSLVSRALSGSAVSIGASTKTIERIRAEAAKLNYHPSAVALSLRGESTRTIGMVIKNFDDPFFGRIIAELQKCAMAEHYSLLLTGCTPEGGSRVDIRTLAKFRLDGLVVAGSDFVPDGLEEFQRRGMRIVRIGSGASLPGAVTIGVDWENGFRQLVAHLQSLGHRDIGYVGDSSASNIRRETLLQKALRRAGLVPRLNSFVRARTCGADAGYEAMQTLLNRCGDLVPTAVVAAEDVLAQTALRALFEHRLNVPQDLTLVGVDDIPAARMTIPSLTTLRQPIAAMVQTAFELIVNPHHRTRAELSVAPELIVRESSAPPARRPI